MFMESSFSQTLWFSSAFLDHLHAWDARLGGLFYTISVICHYLGGSGFFLGLISFLYAFYRPKLALEVSVSLLTAGIIVSLAKFYFESPRPFPYPEAFDEKAFGLPSGHTYSSVVVWGLLFFRIPSLWLRVPAALIILSTPFSRMYLKVHFFADVSLGFSIGLVHLIAVLFFLRYLDQKTLKTYFFHTKSYRTYTLLGIILTLSPIVLDSPFLSEEHHHSLASLLTASGALAGFWIGFLFYPRFSKAHFLDWGLPFVEGKFSIQGLLLRISTLLIIILCFYVLPGQFVKNSIWKEDLFLRYLRYLLIGFALVFLYPLSLQTIFNGKYLLKSENETT